MRLCGWRVAGADGVRADSRTTGKTIVRSFWAIAFCLPSVICRLLMSWADDGRARRCGSSRLAREVIVFVAGLAGVCRSDHRLAPLIGRAERWGRFIAVWNWCNVVEGMLVVVGAFPAHLGRRQSLIRRVELITIGWALWLEWYATRLAFGVGRLTAIWLVLLDQSIGIMLASLAMRSVRDRLNGIVRVADADQGQTIGRRGRARSGSVPGFQGGGDALDGPSALADEFEGADDSCGPDGAESCALPPRFR